MSCKLVIDGMYGCETNSTNNNPFVLQRPRFVGSEFAPVLVLLDTQPPAAVLPH